MARTPARLPNGTRLSDHVTLGVLTATVPAGMIDAVLGETGRQSRRQRQLPARLVVYYVMALALYAQASYGEVSFPRRSGRVVKVDLFRPGDPCPRRDVGSQASSRARR